MTARPMSDLAVDRAAGMSAERTMIAVLLSAAAGSGEAEVAGERIEALLGASGTPTAVTVVRPGTSFRELTRTAIADGATAVVIGGGDGSVSAVASVLAGTDVPLGVLPLGTLNHFAHDLGVPMELEAAVDVIVRANTVKVDVGEVNGHVFINNASVGLYTRLVQQRERYRALGSRKWIAAARALVQTLQNASSMAVRLDVGDSKRLYRTPIVFVGNNEYRMEGLDAAVRESLTGGYLSICVVKARGSWALLRLVADSFWRGAKDAALLDVLRTDRATIETTRHRVAVACDGEVHVMETPLEFRIRPAALTLFVPVPAPASVDKG